MGRSATPIKWEPYQAMLQSLREAGEWRNLLLWAIGGHTAYRVSDYHKIKWSWLTRAAEVTVVEKKTRNRKGKRPRKVYFGPSFVKIIEECRVHMNPSDYEKNVFVAKKQRSGCPFLSENSVNWVLKDCARRHQIPGIPLNVSSHSLRKAFGIKMFSLLGEDFLALIKVSAMYGHNNHQTTLTYLGIDQEEFKRMYEML